MRYAYSFRWIGFGKYEQIKTEIKEPRPEGYYWVKYQDQWQIAEWHNGKWIFLGDIALYTDEHFERIHEEKIEPPLY